MSGSRTALSEVWRGNGARRIARLFVIVGLIAAVVAEGYLITVLRDRIDKQTEDLRTVSLRLQSLKNERDNLHDQLSSIKKSSGGGNDGNTDTR